MDDAEKKRIEQILASNGARGIEDVAALVPNPGVRTAALAAMAASDVAQADLDAQKAREQAAKAEEKAAKERADAAREESSSGNNSSNSNNSSSERTSAKQLSALFRGGTSLAQNAFSTTFAAFVALGIYYFDWLSGFPNQWNTVFFVYILLSLVLATFVFVGSGRPILGFFSLLARYTLVIFATAVFLPRVIKYVFDTFIDVSLIYDSVWFALLFFPPLFLYLVYDPEFGFNQTLRKWVSRYIAIFILVLLIAFISTVTIPFPDSYDRADTVLGVKNTASAIWDGLKKFPDRIAGAINTTQQRLDPMYYTGQIEQNKDNVVLGVKLEDVKPIDPYFLVGQSPTIAGYIRAQSFIGDSVYVTITCLSSRDDVAGFSDNPGQEVYYGSAGFFECTFANNLEAANYPVDVSATFPFETWADITYDFVREDTARDFARLNRDIYQEFDIKERPTAIYTEGPVMIGLGGSRLPILVTDEAPYLKNAYIGFTLQSRWPKGKLNSVSELELKIPNGFELGECDRAEFVDGPYADEKVVDAQGNSLYSRYVFKNTIGPQNPFTSVRCELKITDPQVLPELSSANKATRTFIAMARYSYTITERTQFRVQE